MNDKSRTGSAHVMRAVYVVLLIGVVVTTLVVSCIGGSSSMVADMLATSRDMSGAGDAAKGPVDGALAVDAAKPLLDLAATDLAGLFNCYGVAICDPTTDFCIKYYTGSAADPGNLVNSPACFTPSDTCGNQMLNMNCDCIQNDANTGLLCQGSCVDNADGTFNCYAKP